MPLPSHQPAGATYRFLGERLSGDARVGIGWVLQDVGGQLVPHVQHPLVAARLARLADHALLLTHLEGGGRETGSHG